MNQKILVFNTGSSTIKYKLFEIINNEPVMIKKGHVEDIGLPTGPKNHKVALSILFQGFGLGAPYLGKIEGLSAIGHRVVHGGDEYSKPTLISKDVIKKLKCYSSIAPLHNPRILEVMEDILDHSGQKGHRAIDNYAVFDTSYFINLPEVTKVYPLPYEFYSDYKIRRYGFHGISHEFAVNNVLKKFPSAKKIISLHLGAGCSVAAIKDKKPIDVSMGFTPLEGLMMATRSGDIDAGIIHYLIEKKIINHKEVDKILNFESGLYGISGVADMRELLNIAGYKVEDSNFQPQVYPDYMSKEKTRRAKLAIEMFVYRIKKYIGAYYTICGGCDVLIFTANMATRSSVIRNMILEDLNILKDTKIEIIEADEEQQIAKEIMKSLRK